MPLPQGKLMASEETQANVSTRVQRAMEDLALKGEMQRQQREQAEAEARAKKAQEEEEAEIERIRQARLDRMKKDKAEEEKNIAKGHGEVTSISQDEFLPLVTGSARCVVHFYHRQFERCQVVDARLRTLAPLHPEARFARIDAEKAPFFVERLAVKVLPTIVCFEDGKVIGRKVGFNGETEAEVLFDIESELERVGVIRAVLLPNPNAKKAGKAADDDDDDEVENLQRRTTTLRVGKTTAATDDW